MLQIDSADQFVQTTTDHNRDGSITTMAKSLRSTFMSLPDLPTDEAVQLANRIRELPWGEKAVGFLVDAVTTAAGSIHLKVCFSF